MDFKIGDWFKGYYDEVIEITEIGIVNGKTKITAKAINAGIKHSDNKFLTAGDTYTFTPGSQYARKLNKIIIKRQYLGYKKGSEKAHKIHEEMHLEFMEDKYSLDYYEREYPNGRIKSLLSEYPWWKLVKMLRENESKFKRMPNGGSYYMADGSYGKMEVISFVERDDEIDDKHYINNNYFIKEERAEEVANKINFLLKLERCHDMFCPDYVPDWENSKQFKFRVCYLHSSDRFEVQPIIFLEEVAGVFFPTRGIAERVCDILNGELRQDELTTDDYIGDD